MQVMIGTALLGVMISGVASVLDNSNRTTKALQQKLEILQATQDIIRELSDVAICACNFDPLKNTANAAKLAFDSNSAGAVIEIPQLFATCVNDVPGMPLFEKGKKLAGSQSLIVESIRMKNIVATGTGRFRGELEVAFDKESMVLGRKPASMNLSLVADVTNPGAAKIVSCSSAKAAGHAGLATSCAEAAVKNYEYSYSAPEAPFGAHFLVSTIGSGGSLSAEKPGCGQPYLICTYGSQSPRTTAWLYRENACPLGDSGGGGSVE